MRITLFFLAVGILVSCNSYETEIARLEQENQLLKTQINEIDSVMNGINLTYGDIANNLAVVESKKLKINELASSGELSQEQKEMVLLEMDSIEFLLELNEKKVSELESTIPDDAAEKAALGHIIQGMNEKNTSEGEGINEMKQELAQISSDFSDLFEDFIYQEAENMQMKEQLSSASSELKAAQEKLQLTKERLYTGWYVVGTKDELKAKGIVYTAGFLASKEVNEDFDKTLFKKVHILDFKEILLHGKRATVITTHPSESYELKGIKKKTDRLLIKNPDKFWSVSKFLIIETE